MLCRTSLQRFVHEELTLVSIEFALRIVRNATRIEECELDVNKVVYHSKSNEMDYVGKIDGDDYFTSISSVRSFCRFSNLINTS